jgi:pimeloyl-ACP methyl ester carboxylesterase
MITHTHQTAPTQFVEANGTRFAYRRFGKPVGVPLVFNQHFTGTMDHWDPAVTDGFAKDRQVILFDNAGVSSSSGEVSTTIEDMAANAVAFVKALGLKTVDVLGFSIGGFVAQEITLQAPNLVRRLVLVGTGPRGGQGMATLTPQAQQIFGATYDDPDRLWLAVFFTPSESSQAAGREFLKRFRLRTEDRDPEVNQRVAPSQLEAIVRWGAPLDKPFVYLKDHQADAGSERWQGRNRLPRELVHSAAGTAKFAADPVSGLRARRAISVPQPVRPGRVHLPRWVVRDGQGGLIIWRKDNAETLRYV